MKKIYLLLMAMLMATAINAQTTGYNRLKNVSTGHYANLASSGSFAPNADKESANGLAGTIAYMAFGDNQVTQLRMQGLDVINVAIPMMKALVLTTIDEEQFISMRTTMVEMIKKQMSGAMGSMVARMMEDYTYEEFLEWFDKIDTNLYFEKVEKGDGYRLFMVTPDFPLNGGTFNDYLIEKANQFMKAYTGTLQEKADEYLVGDLEGLRPMAYVFISHMRFGNRMYLTEQTGEYALNFGFANKEDVAKAKSIWDFEPVDNDTNYFGLTPQVVDAEGNYYTSFVADFPITLAEGMKAYYVTDEMEPAESQVKWQAIESESIPGLTPVIIQLKGSSASDNKVQLPENEPDALYLDGNQLLPVANDLGFLLGRTLEEPDPNIYVLDVKEGKVCLASNMEQTMKSNTVYLYLDETRKGENTSSYLFLVDKVTGITEVAAQTKGSNVFYDLQGRRVSQPSKGIYIVNGKKVAY